MKILAVWEINEALYLESSLRAVRVCEPVCANGEQLQLFREHVFQTVFHKNSAVSFRGIHLHAEVFSSERVGLVQHYYHVRLLARAFPFQFVCISFRRVAYPRKEPQSGLKPLAQPFSRLILVALVANQPALVQLFISNVQETASIYGRLKAW